MEFKDILSVALATLIVLVVSHFAVFWVVRTLYPPVPQPMPVVAPVVLAPVVEEPQTFTQPPIVEQHVTLPTYETSVPLEAARQEGTSNFSELQSPPAQRDPGMAPLQS